MIEKQPTQYPEKVRVATMADMPELLRLMEIAHEEQPIAPFCKTSVQATIEAAITGKGVNKGIIGVIGAPSNLEGYFLAFITPWWFSDPANPKGWRLEELTNFVHPNYRNQNHGKRLIQFGKWAAENIGLILVMGIMTDRKLDAKIRLYQRQITPFGALFFHNAAEGSLSMMG